MKVNKDEVVVTTDFECGTCGATTPVHHKASEAPDHPCCMDCGEPTYKVTE